MRVFITGCSGYIGAHLCAHFLRKGHRVAGMTLPHHVVGNLVGRIDMISDNRPWIFRGDTTNRSDLVRCFKTFKPEVVIHLAGQKYAGNDPKKEKEAYNVNVYGTHAVVEAMEECGIRQLIFPSTLEARLSKPPPSVNHKSKQFAEMYLSSHISERHDWSIMVMHQGIVGGTHPSGLLGEDEVSGADGIFAHLCQVACGERNYLPVMPYQRDYVHIDDLVRAYSSATDFVLRKKGFHTVDIGSGVAMPTERLVQTFELANAIHVRHQPATLPAYLPRTVIANPRRAKLLLNWEAHIPLERMCRDMWCAYTTGMGSATTPPYSRIASCRLRS